MYGMYTDMSGGTKAAEKRLRALLEPLQVTGNARKRSLVELLFGSLQALLEPLQMTCCQHTGRGSSSAASCS